MKNFIEKRIELQAPIAKVWQALTNYQEFSEWFGVKLGEPFLPGKLLSGTITHPGYEHTALEIQIQKMNLESFFSFTWHPYAVNAERDYSQEIPTLVEFKLTKISTGTLLILTESGFDKLPQDRRVEAFTMNDSGWAQQMNNIESYVKNR